MRRIRDALLERWRSDTRLRFIAVGGWNTVVGYMCFFAFYVLFRDRLHYLLIGLLAHVVAAMNAFACHRLFVYRSRGEIVAEFVRFNLAQLTVLACGLAALWLLVTGLGLTPPLGQALVTIASVALSYLAHRHFTFAT